MTDRSRLIQQVDAWSAADPDEAHKEEIGQGHETAREGGA